MNVSQIQSAGVDRLITGPERSGNDDKRQSGRQGNWNDDATIGDAGFVPFVFGDGQVAIERGHRQANQQNGIINATTYTTFTENK